MYVLTPQPARLGQYGGLISGGVTVVRLSVEESNRDVARFLASTEGQAIATTLDAAGSLAFGIPIGTILAGLADVIGGIFAPTELSWKEKQAQDLRGTVGAVRFFLTELNQTRTLDGLWSVLGRWTTGYLGGAGPERSEIAIMTSLTSDAATFQRAVRDGWYRIQASPLAQPAGAPLWDAPTLHVGAYTDKVEWFATWFRHPEWIAVSVQGFTGQLDLNDRLRRSVTTHTALIVKQTMYLIGLIEAAGRVPEPAAAPAAPSVSPAAAAAGAPPADEDPAVLRALPTPIVQPTVLVPTPAGPVVTTVPASEGLAFLRALPGPGGPTSFSPAGAGGVLAVLLGLGAATVGVAWLARRAPAPVF